MSKMKVTRRDLLSASILGAAGLTVPAPNAFAAGIAKAPNIVFILADDLGYADVSCYGRPDLKTPNIDRLAAEGIKFSQAYANSAVCSATRVALMTGRYQYRLRVGLEEPIPNNSNVGLPADHPTLPSLLKKIGYNTALIGKWHLGPLPDYGPLKSGYDHFYGFRGGSLDYFSNKTSDHKDDLWDGDTLVHEHGYLTDLLGQKAVDLIATFAKQSDPFFLSLHFNAPHWPWEGPEDQAESQRLEKSRLNASDSGTQHTYQRMIEAMDDQIGKVLQALTSAGLSHNTIVIFTSDNGGERFADTWPFTGRKTELLEGGLRIPAIMRWQGIIKAGGTTDQVAISMDWLPTLLAAAGANPDPAYPSDGMNLLPFVKDRTLSVSRKLFWRYKANAQRAARDGNYKVLKRGANTFLFDVVADPMERANLKVRHKEIYDRLVQAWNDWDATMLPEIRESFTDNFSGASMADHLGAQKAGGEPDLGTEWPDSPI
jgi:arylsulfatase A-like enzyme